MNGFLSFLEFSFCFKPFLIWVAGQMVVMLLILKNNPMNNSFQDIINSEKPVLIDFFATWCGPCQMLGPVLTQVKDSLGERVSIIKVDVDKNQELAATQQVRGVPTMILFQNGQQLWRQSGVLSKEEIIKVILDKTN